MKADINGHFEKSIENILERMYEKSSYVEGIFTLFFQYSYLSYTDEFQNKMH